MAIDTKTKRLAMVNFGAHAETLPEPSGGFDAADRSHLLDLYSMPGETIVHIDGVYLSAETLSRPTFSGEEVSRAQFSSETLVLEATVTTERIAKS